MEPGAWVLVVAVVVALGLGGWRTLTNGVFRGTHRVRGAVRSGVVSTGSTDGVAGSAVVSTGSTDGVGGSAVVSTGSTDGVAGSADGVGGSAVVSTDGADGVAGSTDGADGVSVLAGTAYDERRGERATLLQFSSAFCAPCRATRRTLVDVATAVPGVAHVEVDAEHHLDLVRALGVVRTPTTLVLDSDGREVTRATGAPRPAQVLAALEGGVR
jgi:thiol-disulfide isomerase/thioredoxin